MPCARGCCATQAEHYRSLMVASPGRKTWRKITTDVHDTHKVDVTEHWQDRQDVTVRDVQPITMHADDIKPGLGAELRDKINTEKESADGGK